MAEVKFKFVGDDSELRKKLANLAKIQSEMTEKFSENLNKALSNSKSQGFKDLSKDAEEAARQTEILNKASSNKSIVNAKMELIESIRKLRNERAKELSDLNILKQIEAEAKTVLAEKKLITESLIQSEKALNNEYLKTGKDLNEYSLKLKENAEERRKANLAEREAEKALKASEKTRKDGERDAAKQAKETEKRKKQLEQESSEYYKLNKALGAVRKETKDVLAEMFRMERQGHANTLGYQALKKKSEDLTKQTQYLDRGIKKIDSTLGLHQRNVGNYGSAIELLGPQFESINQKLSLFGTSIDDLVGKPNAFKELGQAISGFGKQLWALVTTPVGALLATLGGLFALFQSNKQTVVDFNAGLRDVSKTTGIVGADLDDFGDAIIDLSMKLKVIDSTKLLEYATVAGQLGVKGRSDILAFTEALAMLETASNINGEEGATEIARMLTLVDGGVQNVKDFGDEIVNLGNNFAATEKEILANAEQIAQNVGIYKIGRQDVLAFATATKAVGLEAELVGSTFSRTLGEFEKTIRSGKGISDLLKVIGGTSKELSKRFKDDAAGVFVDYVRGLNDINKSGGSVNEALERTGIIAVRDQRVIASLATNGFDVLTDALKKVTTAQGAMQTEFENGAGKLEQQTKRIGIAWDNLVLSIENGEGAIGRSVVRVVGFFATIFDEITRLVKSDSWNEFFGRVGEIGASGNGQLKTVQDFKKAYYEIKKDSQAVNFGKNDFTLLSEKQLKDELERLKTLKEFAVETATDYEAAILGGRLSEKGNLFKSSAGKLRLFKSLEQDAANAYDKVAKIASIKIKNDAVIPKKTFEELEAERKKREEADEKAKKALERRTEQARQALERQRKLQGDIEALVAQSSLNQLSRDDEEVSSIRDKYAKMREEVHKFYADPKNSGLKVDAGKLQQAEDFELSELSTRQGTKSLLKQLNEQRDLYAEYNSYVEQNGIEAAEKMFGKQAEFAKNYRTDLEKEYLEITSLQKIASLNAFSGTDVKLTQAQEERAKELKQMLDALNKEDQAQARSKYAEALKMAQTFGEQEFAIRKRYNDALAQLGKDANEEQREVLKRVLQEDLEALVESSPKFKKAIDDINDSSQAMLTDAFKTGKETVLEIINGMSDATQEQKAELSKIFGKFFDDGIRESKKGNFQEIASMAGAFENLVQSSFEFSGNLGNGLKTISQMVSSAGQLSSMLGSFFKNDTLSNLSGPLAIGGAVFGIVGSITNFFNQKQAQSNQRFLEQMEAGTDRQLKATQSVTIAIQQQVDLLNEIYGAERLEKYAKSLIQIEGNWKKVNDQLGGKFQMTGDAFTDDILTKLNLGYSKNDLTKGMAPGSSKFMKTLETWSKAQNGTFARFGQLPEDISKAQEELARLQIQIESGNADSTTQELYNQLQAQMDLYTDVTNKLKEEATGNSFSSLLSEVTNLFFNEGENAADAWAQGFDKIMENYLMQKFSRDFLQEKMQGWYDMMNDFAEDGIDDTERGLLKDYWDKLKEEGETVLDSIRDVLGQPSSGSGSSGSLGTTAIKGATEQQFSEYLGINRAIYDINKQQLLQLQATGKTTADYLGIANSHLIALNSINTNTANTVARLDTAIVHLQNIDRKSGGVYV